MTDFIPSPFYLEIDFDNARYIHANRKDAMAMVHGMNEGARIYYVDPVNQTCIDQTAGMAEDWFDDAGVYDNPPDVFKSYIGHKVFERRDRHETSAEDDRGEYQRDDLRMGR